MLGYLVQEALHHTLVHKHWFLVCFGSPDKTTFVYESTMLKEYAIFGVTWRNIVIQSVTESIEQPQSIQPAVCLIIWLMLSFTCDTWWCATNHVHCNQTTARLFGLCGKETPGSEQKCFFHPNTQQWVTLWRLITLMCFNSRKSAISLWKKSVQLLVLLIYPPAGWHWESSALNLLESILSCITGRKNINSTCPTS